MSVTPEILVERASGLEELQRESNHRQMRKLRPLGAVRPASPMPTYVEHRLGVNEVGRLSAEAVVRVYEAAVRQIEALGSELQDAASKCETMVAGALGVAAEIREVAASYRDQGKRYFLQIEAVSLMTAEVRDTCEMLKKKIAAEPLTP
jgi:hypothetical protein